MNGAHDLGGREGLGPVNPTTEEPLFHADWERTVFTLFVPAVMAGMNLDEFRHGIEQMHPVEYLSSPYYEHWLHTFVHGLIDKGVISAEEMEAKARLYRENPDAPLPARSDPEQAKLMLDILRAGASTKMEVTDTPRFKVGQTVEVRNYQPTGHTRLAGYLRGKVGTVDRVYDAFVFPDTNSRREGEQPQYIYSVRFDAAHVWGPDTAEPNETIYFDFWESYLTAA